MNMLTNSFIKSAGLVIVISAFFTISASAQGTQNDDTEIKLLVKTLEEGWGKKDGKLFAQPFAENADYVIINGMHIKGKMEIANGHQQIFDTFYKETMIKTTVEDIRYPKPDLAIAHIFSNLTGNVAGKSIDGKGRITLTLLKENGKWDIQAFQNTEIVNQGPPQRSSNE